MKCLLIDEYDQSNLRDLSGQLIMKRAILIFLVVCGFSWVSFAQNVHENLSKELSKLYDNSGLSGFAVSIVTGDSVLYKKSFGFEDIEAQKLFNNEQRLYIASISKTFIGIGLMKLMENGDLELSTPVNTILPFQVINPHFIDTEITIEHLARHTSSILYDDLETKSWYLDKEFDLDKRSIGSTAFKDFSAWAKNKPISLAAFLKECLTEEGEFYSASRFSKNKPGTSYEYSNLGAALAAYIIEIKTGVDYRDYIEEIVTKELGFGEDVWRNVSIEKLPTSYFQEKIKVPIHAPILYPAGGMMLSCDELSSYLMEMIRGFNGNSLLLNPDSFQTMMNAPEDQDGKSGIFWELNGDKIGHNGGNYGVTVFMNFNKKTGIGKIFMTNISSYKNDQLIKEMLSIWRKMAEYESLLNP